MITKEIEVNGSKFNLTLTDQVISQVDNLKSLYATAAEDPEMFEQVSSEISTTINQIAASVTPEASDSYLDGLIQEIFKAVEDKKSEVEKQMKSKDAKITRKKLKTLTKYHEIPDEEHRLRSILSVSSSIKKGQTLLETSVLECIKNKSL